MFVVNLVYKSIKYITAMKTKLLLLGLFMTGIASSQVISLELVSDGFDPLSEIASAGDDRLFVVEQSGHIKILNPDGTANETNFLDVNEIITSGGERGLLGLAFHPEYETNGYFFVNYTNLDGDTVIARYTRTEGNENTANPASAVVMLVVEQPFDNHNGGCLRFGPDGYLYVGMGDGGDAGDPGNRAQNMDELLGKMLRLDVDAAGPPYIPETNPFVGINGADEIWASGLRNPWKFSFNMATGDLWIADVGQGQVEEINKSLPTAEALNYGWKCYEGTLEYDTELCAEIGTYAAPIAEYANAGSPRCSITGGYVYMGTNYPNLQNKYVFADYCTSEIGVVGDNNAITWVGDFDGNITTFGEDADGELYVGTGDGSVYRITDTSAGLNDFANSPFALYPNPANDEVFINSKDGLATGLASIFNVSGQLILEQQFDGTSRIDTSKLQTGVYMVNIQTSGSRYNTKLVIN